MRPALSGYYLQQNWINAQIVPTRIFKSSNLPPRRTQKIWFLSSDMSEMFENVVQYLENAYSWRKCKGIYQTARDTFEDTHTSLEGDFEGDILFNIYL